MRHRGQTRERPVRMQCLVGPAAVLAVCGVLTAQDLEPRRWTHLPVDTNVIGAGYLFTKGDIAFDPALRIEDAEVELHTLLASYTRYFALFETTARVDVVVPYQHGEWQGLLDGAPAAVERDGFGDPAVRLSASLLGAPALRGQEFAAFQREHDVDTAVGAAVEVRLPLGEYHEDKLINLGQNRYTIAPQLGVLHTRGLWSYELTGTAAFFTDNDEFFGGLTLEQDPLFAAQAHVVRVFPEGFWLSAGAAYGWGGETSIDGDDKGDERSNLLWGGSVGFRLGSSQGIRIAYLHADSRTDTGADTDNVLVMWTLRF
jgi:hypothetical protein